MLSLTLQATVLALSTVTAYSQLDSPSPHQLTFNSPSSPSSASGELLRLRWSDKAALEQAVELFEEHDLDIWHAGRRTTPGRPPSEAWEAIVRWPTPAEDGQDAPTEAYERLSAAGIPIPEEGASLFSLSERLSSPLISTSYSRSLSAASITNLSSPISSSSASSTPPLSSTSNPIHDTYHPYEGIYQILSQLEETYPEWVKVYSLGKSSEGRDIWAAKVTNLSSSAEEARTASPLSVEQEEEEEDGDEEDEPENVPPPLITLLKKRHKHKRTRKLGFVVAGTQHAREWIAASTTLYLMHDLLAVGEGLGGFERSEKARAKLLNQVEFTFVPVVNPDGYVYSWDVDRLWRKSRQPVGKGCYGIDLNRNWGFKFQPGSRPNPCSDSYPGSKPFESVELQALSELIASSSEKEKKVDAFLDVHSFGQMLLYPYSYTCSLTPPDGENLSEAVLLMSKALKSIHGRSFETGSVCEVSLTSPGESLDWSYAVEKVRWSFGTELRDGGVFGFLLPPSQIRPSGEEMSAALRSLTQFILDKEAGKR